MLKQMTPGVDSHVPADGRLIERIDSSWKIDQLPFDEIEVPVYELADPDADNGQSNLESIREIDSKWRDFELHSPRQVPNH